MGIKNALPAVLWALLIAVLCGMPGKKIPHISFIEFPGLDKIVHAFLFYVFCLLLVKSFSNSEASIFLQNNSFLFAFVFSVLYGVLIEWMQKTFFMDRTADLFDSMANSFGALFALIYLKFFSRQFTKP